jgi:hypothetical protein
LVNFLKAEDGPARGAHTAPTSPTFSRTRARRFRNATKPPFC